MTVTQQQRVVVVSAAGTGGPVDALNDRDSIGLTVTTSSADLVARFPDADCVVAVHGDGVDAVAATMIVFGPIRTSSPISRPPCPSKVTEKLSSESSPMWM